jgi:hypothetical protein
MIDAIIASRKICMVFPLLTRYAAAGVSGTMTAHLLAAPLNNLTGGIFQYDQ